MTNYPVKVARVITGITQYGKSCDDYNLIDASGKTLVEGITSRDLANKIANSLNAIHEYPGLGEPMSCDDEAIQVSEWEKKFHLEAK